MRQQKGPNISLLSALFTEAEQAASAVHVNVDEWVREAVERRLRQAQEAAASSLARSQLAGQRIRELRRGATLVGLSTKELIEEGRE